MVWHYLKIGLRTLWCDKLTALINLAGLSIGLACTILLALYAQWEFSHDRHWPAAERLHRLEAVIRFPNGNTVSTSKSSGALKPVLLDDHPEVTASARLSVALLNVRLDRGVFDLRSGFVDPAFLTLFPLTDIGSGQPLQSASLEDPGSVYLSHDQAQRLFGDADPIGQTIFLRGQFPHKVAGLFSTDGKPTHLALDLIGSIRSDAVNNRNELETDLKNSLYTYARLAPGVSAKAVSASLTDGGPFTPNGVGVKPQLRSFGHDLMPVTAIHLQSRKPGNIVPGGNIYAVVGIAVLAALILLIAAANFVSLSLARSDRRVREMALRKIVGAQPRLVGGQLLMETGLLCGFAIGVAVVLVELFTDIFAQLVATPLSTADLYSAQGLAFLLLLLVMTTVLAGALPSLMMAGVRPARSLQKRQKFSPRRWLGGALLSTQFAVSMTFGIGALVVYLQIQFIGGYNLGYDPENVVVYEAREAQEMPVPTARLAETIAGIAGVESAVAIDRAPGNFRELIAVMATSANERGMAIVNHVPVGPGFGSVFRPDLIAGRLLDTGTESDRGGNLDLRHVLITRTAADVLGLPVGPSLLGQELPVETHLSAAGMSKTTYRIVGVIEDLLFGTVHEKPLPLFVVPDPGVEQIAVRLKPGKQVETLKRLDRFWSDTVPTITLKRWFVDERLAAQYDKENRLGTLVGVATVLALFIATIGLYGLSAFSMHRRRREISIRKLVGARLHHIVRLFAWQQTLPILVANLFAWPAAYALARYWLEGFDKRMALSPEPFLLVGLAGLLLAWAIVSLHCISAMRNRPAETLRHE